MTYTHPAELSPEQRRENLAALHARIARAATKAGNEKTATIQAQQARDLRAK